MKPWNKGQNKFTNRSLMQTSITMSSKTKSNFWEWQQKNKQTYKLLNKNTELAELYGTILGDGCMEKFPRTDKLTISFNRKEADHLEHVKKIIKKVIGKEPKIRVRKNAQCNDLYLYQKFLSKRLSFPYGVKIKQKLIIPSWIKNNKSLLRHCLKGLFETDGDRVTNNKYKTDVIKFNNHCLSLLEEVHTAIKGLGFHPQKRRWDIRLAQKKEVNDFAKLIKFRKY